MTSIVVVSNLLPGIASRFEGHVVDTINTALLATAEAADPHTNVDTGALRANKTFTMASPGNFNGEISWDQDYAIYQDRGTIYIQGTYFAEKGVEAATPSYLADLASLGM